MAGIKDYLYGLVPAHVCLILLSSMAGLILSFVRLYGLVPAHVCFIGLSPFEGYCINKLLVSG